MENGLTLKFTRSKWLLNKDGATVATFVNASAGRSLAVAAALDGAKMWMFDGVNIDGPKAEVEKLVQWWPGIPAAATDNYIPMK